jgi:hypothetical protein
MSQAPKRGKRKAGDGCQPRAHTGSAFTQCEACGVSFHRLLVGFHAQECRVGRVDESARPHEGDRVQPRAAPRHADDMNGTQQQQQQQQRPSTSPPPPSPNPNPSHREGCGCGWREQADRYKQRVRELAKCLLEKNRQLEASETKSLSTSPSRSSRCSVACPSRAPLTCGEGVGLGQARRRSWPS